MSHNNILPLDSLVGYIWFNGQFINWQAAKTHFLTHSLHYGGSVFEGEKAINGKIFRLKEHTDRLFSSAVQMKLRIPYTKTEIMDASNELLSKNNLPNAYLRPLVWRSSSSLMVCPPTSDTNVMIAAWSPRKKHSTDNLNLTVSNWVKPAPEMIPVQCKSASQYAMMTVVCVEAKEEGFDDAILLDNKGCITECTTSNIFFIKDQQLITPTTRNCLNGITRQTVINIAREKGILVIERDIILEEINLINSAFTTGTANGIKEIGSISFTNEKISFKENALIASIKDKYEKLLHS